MSHALIVAAEKSLAQPGGAERAVLELCLALRSGFGDAVHQALRLVAPLYLECGDNGLRRNAREATRWFRALERAAVADGEDTGAIRKQAAVWLREPAVESSSSRDRSDSAAAAGS